MLAKLTAKNQFTLPKSAVQAVGEAEYFDVEVREGQIVLTPVRIQRGDAVRAKLSALGLAEAGVADAVRWSRAGGAAMRAPPRVVLHTNAVLSALVFGAGTPARVRAGWQAGRFVPLASTATAHELVRVLACPKFGLSAAEQAELLADFLPRVRVAKVPEPPPAVPRCRDPFDVMSLHLAVAGKARALASGDRDLLLLAGAQGICPIVTVDAFCRTLLDG